MKEIFAVTLRGKEEGRKVRLPRKSGEWAREECARADLSPPDTPSLATSGYLFSQTRVRMVSARVRLRRDARRQPRVRTRGGPGTIHRTCARARVSTVGSKRDSHLPQRACARLQSLPHTRWLSA